MRADRRRYVIIWAFAAWSFGILLAIAEHERNPLNDADPAQQRTGMLLPTGVEPMPKIECLHVDAGPTVVVFDRQLQGRHLFHDLADQSDVARLAKLVVVTSDGSKPLVEQGIHCLLADPDETIAEAFRLRRPIDGGYPIGYVLVDRSGFIRFRTLDPGYDERGWEIRLLLGEVRRTP